MYVFLNNMFLKDYSLTQLKRNILERDRMHSDRSSLGLIKQNIKHFFSEVRSRKESKKKYRLDLLSRNIPLNNSSGYKDFTPKSKISNSKEYINALHWALKNEKVKNIALAGPYGAGKSSIIRSYLKKHPSTRALNISLATFDWEKKEYDEFKNEVELGILKQLFYKVDSSKIPQSRYRKIHKRYYRHFVLVVTIIAVVFLSVLWFFFPKTFDSCIDWIAKSGKYHNFSKDLSLIITGIFGIFGILIVSYMSKWVATHFRIKEINIADKATVSDEKEEESIFDRNMDEIVYFFEETSYDTVFIEDLDRFDSSEIFVKLRELNTILNNYDLIKRRIVFVYAVKDDMFKDEERTKFFDFIIPVIPIINSTNSGEILRKKLKVAIQKDGTYKSSLYDISSSFITLISPFIEDMRVLTSICNEFVVYKKTLQSLHLKDEEMFSIMVFKNLFPTDFAELETERGIVKKAFEDKKIFINEKIEELKRHNEELLSVLERMDQDILVNLEEVKAAFLNSLTEGKGAFNHCDLDGNRYSYTQIMQYDFDMKLFNSNSHATVYYYYDINGREQHRIIENMQMEITKGERNYIQRFNYLQNSVEDRKEEIRKDIEDNELFIMNLRAFSLKSLLEEYEVKEVLSDEVRENKILVFLLRKGFINENYADYINYFHPNSITSDEMNYIRGIRMEEAVGDFSYRINNVAQVCDRIEDYEFKQAEALNYDVTDYLITKMNGDTKCTKLFEGLAQGSDNAIEFIKSYIERNQNIPIFIKTLCKHYSAFWYNVCNNETFSEDGKFKYLSLICSWASIEDIVCMNAVEYGSSMDNFIIERKHALPKLRDVNSEKMIRIIEQLDLCFTCIDIEGADKHVLEYIFEENQYELNISMITSLFAFKYPEKVAELEKANYTTIRETADTSLMLYIHGDFKKYVTDFVLGQDTNIDEDIHAVEDILERLYKTNLEICKEVLDKEEVIWNDLNDCCRGKDEKDGEVAKNVIWNYVLQNQKIDASWYNFSCYYDRYGLTRDLVAWVNEEIDQLIQDDQVENITDEIIKFIIVEDISLDTFEKIIKRFKVKEFTNSLRDFSSDGIRIMVKEQYIPFGIKLLDEMQEVALDLVKEYVVYNKGKFFENIDEISLNLHTIAQLLNTSELDNNEKIKLFEFFSEEDVDKELALSIRELPFLVNKAYVEAAWQTLEEGDRYQLLLNQLEVYSLDEISNKLSTLAPVYQKLSDRTKRHREYLDVDGLGYNKELLRKLKDIEYLTSVEVKTYYEDDAITHKKVEKQRFGVWVKQKLDDE